MPPPSGLPEEYDHAMQLHSAGTSSSSLTGTPDDVPQLPVGQAPGSPGAVARSARLASLHRAFFFFFFFFFFLVSPIIRFVRSFVRWGQQGAGGLRA